MFTLVTELHDFHFHVAQWQGLFFFTISRTLAPGFSHGFWLFLFSHLDSNEEEKSFGVASKRGSCVLRDGLIILIRCDESFCIHIYVLNPKGAGDTGLARFIPQQTTLRERGKE